MKILIVNGNTKQGGFTDGVLSVIPDFSSG